MLCCDGIDCGYLVLRKSTWGVHRGRWILCDHCASSKDGSWGHAAGGLAVNGSMPSAASTA